jgi:protein-tyrosine kinase
MERLQAAILKAKQQRGQILNPLKKVLRPPHSAESAENWGRLKKINVDAKRMDAHRIVTFSQTNPVHSTFDMMRAKLLRVIRQNGWTTVGFTSVSPDNGKTMICLNLAFSLAHQQGSRTVVCDLDLRQPRIAEILGTTCERSIDGFLKGYSPVEEVFRCYGNGLAIGMCDRPAEDPAELLQSKSSEDAMNEIRQKLDPDVILIDLPPMLIADDVMSFLPNLDGIFLVVAAEATALDTIESCAKQLSEHTNVLGVVLNKCRYPNDSDGHYQGYY